MRGAPVEHTALVDLDLAAREVDDVQFARPDIQQALGENIRVRRTFFKILGHSGERSALTGATLETICADVATRAVARAMMLEAQAIAERLGVKFPLSADKRIAGAAAVGAHKTSMLQDLERGRVLETDALVAAVAELERLVEINTPIINTVLALIELRARQALNC